MQVLATGLSGLYSSLPTKLEEKGEEWHCLLKDDWLLLPPLVQFMNSLEFCNAVIQVPALYTASELSTAECGQAIQLSFTEGFMGN